MNVIRVKLIALTVAALLVAIAPARATSVGFAGIRYQDALRVSAGVGTNVTGALWSFSYADAGKYGSLTTEVGVVTGLGKYGYKGAWIGALAGPNVDFGNESADGSTSSLNYLTGAAGVIGGLWFNPKIGVWGYVKYKFELDEAATYQNGCQGGAGINVGL